MNITDLIVEKLKQGQNVALPGIGTLGSVMRPPYHDKERGIYYPAHRSIVFDPAVGDDSTMVTLLAERECVGMEVARQMWKNYLDALSDKLHRTGNHQLGDLGAIHCDEQSFRFEAADGVVLSVGDEKPIEGVKLYAHNDEEDPFAQFEEEASKEPEAIETPEIQEEPEIQEIQEEPEVPETLDTPEKSEVQEHPEYPETPEVPEVSEISEPVKEEEETIEPSIEDDLKKLDEIPVIKKGKEEKDEKKKKGGFWWIILIVVLLLLCGAGAYYYFNYMRNADKTEPIAEPAITEHIDGVPVTNDLTYNYDLIEYDRRDIVYNRDYVCRYMADYIENYLVYRHYTGARVPMAERVSQYTEERLNTLLADRFAIQRLIPFNDYIYNHNEPWMKQTFASRQRIIVQRELLDMKVLDSILDRLVSELGIEPDAGAPGNADITSAQESLAINPKPATKPAVKEEEPAPVRVNVEQESKLGFDIIAGFYLDRATAARMTARLHELGSDAYIIEKNNMYYVSMGSAKNRTAAEALFKHIKGWYDGDIAIKQW